MFKKIGDANPILSAYDEDGKVKKCDKCGKILTTVAIDSENELVCDCETPEPKNEK